MLSTLNEKKKRLPRSEDKEVVLFACIEFHPYLTNPAHPLMEASKTFKSFRIPTISKFDHEYNYQAFFSYM